MIDPSVETLIPVADCAHFFPPRKRRSRADPDGPPSEERSSIGYSTMMRLCVKGDKRGVKLESLLVSGVRYTSHAAIMRFLKAAAVEGVVSCP